MSKLARRTRLLLALLSALLTPGVVEAQGILLLAHGGSGDWNREVLALADRIDSSRPVEVAFGMANKRTIQDAVDRLTERGVSGIVAVPLFISSHSSVLRATEYLLGSRDEAPPELQAFARMGARRDSGHADADADADADPSFDRTTRVETAVPISVTTALDGHSLVAEILISRALDVSRTPEEEIVVLVAHGPSSAEDNDLWLDNMGRLAERMRTRTRFSRIQYLTVRDDAPDPVQSQATTELRAVVEGAVQDGNSVLVVPLLSPSAASKSASAAGSRDCRIGWHAKPCCRTCVWRSGSWCRQRTVDQHRYRAAPEPSLPTRTPSRRSDPCPAS